METIELVAHTRDLGAKNKALRRQKLIPAVCYGRGFKNRNIQVDYQAFRKAYKAASTTQIINLDVEGEKVPVLIHEITYNPMSDNFHHVDFLQLDLKKKVDAKVPVVLVGVSPAVKNFNGVVTLAKHEIEVRCLPMKIPHEITLDISTMENIGDVLHVKDLSLPKDVEILDELEDSVVSINAFVEYVEEVAEVPEELKAEPVAGAEGAPAAEGGEKAAAEGDKKEEKK